MTRIVYKKLIGKYFADSFSVSDGKGILIEFSEPIDAKLVIGEKVHTVKRGVCRIPEETLPEEKISPKLYTGRDMFEPESFVYKNGTAHPVFRGDELVKDALRMLDLLENRLSTAEAEISDLRERVTRKIDLI